jgi:NAD(P)-dependent dehydrogenase (short-subunit alcohol dehydrogenase family)
MAGQLLPAKVASVAIVRRQGRIPEMDFASQGAEIMAVDASHSFDIASYALSIEAGLAEIITGGKPCDRRVISFQVDVYEPSAMSAATARGVAECGQLDVVVANACFSSMQSQPPKTRIRVSDVSFSGLLNTPNPANRHVLPEPP